MQIDQRVDLLTIAGFGALLVPILSMWHEIGGHAAACVVQGGHVATIGAFYVECTALTRLPRMIVSSAGVALNALLSIGTYFCWRRTKQEPARLILWLVWVSEAFVSTGYLCFSGATGSGDLGTGANGALAWLPLPLAWRLCEVAVGVIAYGQLIRAATCSLNDMLGTGSETRTARRVTCHGYYIVAGLSAILIALLNPMGAYVTIMSAGASSFGGLAGFISIGFAASGPDAGRSFHLYRNWTAIIAGGLVLAAFALVLGPWLQF